MGVDCGTALHSGGRHLRKDKDILLGRTTVIRPQDMGRELAVLTTDHNDVSPLNRHCGSKK